MKRVKRLLSVMVSGLLLFQAVGAMAAQDKVGEETAEMNENVYFVDSQNGNDTGDGSIYNPWQSLEKINRTTFKPGDTILIKAGSVFNGQLVLNGSGSEAEPIIVDMYGDGPKPVICANGQYREALLIENVEYWEVNNLDLSNKGEETTQHRAGVRLCATGTGEVYDHIYLRNLYVHDVNGVQKKCDEEGCGIYIECVGREIKTGFNDIRIENNHVANIDRNGIAQYNQSPNRSTNVLVRNNLLENIGGDGIKIWGTDGALVEYNTIRGGQLRSGNASAGIWPFASTNVIMQYNEVSGLHGTMDGQAFDADFYTVNTVAQYNYSHDNDGGFMLFCSPGYSYSDGTVVRYNISQNDGSPGGSIMQFGGKATNTTVYNNVFYVPEHKSGFSFLKGGSWEGGGPSDNSFYNNVFYIEGALTKFGYAGENSFFSNNVFYGQHFEDEPEDKYKITENPRFVAAGGAGFGMDTAKAYMLLPTSPLIGKGAVIDETKLGNRESFVGKENVKEFDNYNTGKDFFGNSVDITKARDIGAHQYSNDTCVPSCSQPVITKVVNDRAGEVKVYFDAEEGKVYDIKYISVNDHISLPDEIKGVTASPAVIENLEEDAYLISISTGDSFESKQQYIEVDNVFLKDSFEENNNAWNEKSGKWTKAVPEAENSETINTWQDDFGNGDGNWNPTVKEDWEIIYSGGLNIYELKNASGGRSSFGNTIFKDFTAEVDMTPTQFMSKGCVSINLRENDKGGYMVLLAEGAVLLKKNGKDGQTQLAEALIETKVNRKRHIKVNLTGDEITVFADGKEVIKYKDSEHSIGWVSLGGWNASAYFENFKITGTSVLSENRGYIQAALSRAKSIYEMQSWDNYAFSVDVTPIAISRGGKVFEFIRVQENGDGYFAGFESDKIVAGVVKNGVMKTIDSVNMALDVNKTYELTFTALESNIAVKVNGEEKITFTDNTFEKGTVGLYTNKAKAAFDNVLVKGVK